MVFTTTLIGIVALALPGRPNPALLVTLIVVGLVELAFFAVNAAKFIDGGWFPLTCALVLFVMMTTWKRAETILAWHEAQRRVPLENLPELIGPGIARVPGTAIYLSPDPKTVPAVLLHNLKHNKVLHERMVFLTIVNADVPRISDRDRTELNVIEPHRVFQVSLHYGFMEEPDVPKGLLLLQKHYGQRFAFEPEATTFFLGKTTLARAARPGLFTWRRELFRWLQRNSPATAEYFKLMPERVVELGTRISI
jgi:KUP system potassium uptake protein